MCDKMHVMREYRQVFMFMVQRGGSDPTQTLSLHILCLSYAVRVYFNQSSDWAINIYLFTFVTL